VPRDSSLLALLYGACLRRAEAVALYVDQVDPASGQVTARHGKGRKDRLAWLTNGALAAVGDWLAVRGDEPGALLTPVNKGGCIDLRGMTGQAVLYRLRARAGQAGVKRFSPHDLRRSYASDLLDAGADIVVVQGLIGHASVTTTARYDRRPEEAKRAGAARLHFPHTARSAGQRRCWSRLSASTARPRGLPTSGCLRCSRSPCFSCCRCAR
jgi:site-specific recombinase XerD